MIGQLIWTGGKANRALFGAFTGLTFVLFFLAVDQSGLSLSAGTTVSILVSVVAGGVFFVRSRQEKRIRALSQLPTTALQVGVSGWCVTLLGLSVPCLCWLLFASLPGSRWGLTSGSDGGAAILAQLLRSMAVFYCGAVCVVAAVSISVNLTSRPPLGARHLKWVWAVGAAIGAFVFANSPEARGLLLSAQVLIPLGSGLVIADLWLDNRADNYLG